MANDEERYRRAVDDRLCAIQRRLTFLCALLAAGALIWAVSWAMGTVREAAERSAAEATLSGGTEAERAIVPPAPARPEPGVSDKAYYNPRTAGWGNEMVEERRTCGEAKRILHDRYAAEDAHIWREGLLYLEHILGCGPQ